MRRLLWMAALAVVVSTSLVGEGWGQVTPGGGASASPDVGVTDPRQKCFDDYVFDVSLCKLVFCEQRNYFLSPWLRCEQPALGICLADAKQLVRLRQGCPICRATIVSIEKVFIA